MLLDSILLLFFFISFLSPISTIFLLLLGYFLYFQIHINLAFAIFFLNKRDIRLKWKHNLWSYVSQRVGRKGNLQTLTNRGTKSNPLSTGLVLKLGKHGRCISCEACSGLKKHCFEEVAFVIYSADQRSRKKYGNVSCSFSDFVVHLFETASNLTTFSIELYWLSVSLFSESLVKYGIESCDWR